MRFLTNSIAAVLFFAGIAAGQDLQIKGGDVRIIERDRLIVVKDKIQTTNKFPFQLEAPAGGLLYSWRFPVGVTAIERGNVLEVTAAPKGDLTVSVQWAVIDWDARKVDNKSAALAFAVGEPGPVPPTPVPPTPVPPVPVPPSPAPIPVDGFRVLFIVESAASIPADQRTVLASATVRSYLNSKCVLGPDGKTREWRQWDQHTPVDGEAAHWQAAMKRSRSSLPWLIISDGKRGWEGPMPKTIAETMAKLKEVGGE